MENSYRISGGTEFLMKAVAAMVYGCNFLIEITTAWFGVGLFLSPFLMVSSCVVFALWFKLKEVSVLDKEIAAEFLIGAILSAIPLVNLLYFSKSKNGIILPGIVAKVSRVIEISKEQDKRKILSAIKREGQGEKEQPDRHTRPSYRPNGSSNRYEQSTAEEMDIAA